MEQVQTKPRLYNSIRDKYENAEILFDLPIRVYYWYCGNVKGNEGISYETAQKKLSRNVYLARESELKRNEDRLYFFYGNMTICLNKKNEGYEIGYINNNSGRYDFNVNFEYRDYLNKRFNIIQEAFKYDYNYIAALEEMVFVTE